MALSDAYATAAEYRAAIKPDADSSGDAALLVDLKAISRYLEGKLGRFFNQDASNTTSVYVPNSSAGVCLEVDDFSAAPTSVSVDDDGDGVVETTLAATDFEMRPLNALLRPEPWPYTHINLTAWGSRGCWSGAARVAVVGKRGWPAVPAAVKGGVIQLTAIYRLETPRATRRIPEMGDAIESSPDAQRIIRELTAQYKRWVMA